jgi:hypothetical protein
VTYSLGLVGCARREAFAPLVLISTPFLWTIWHVILDCRSSVLPSNHQCQGCYVLNVISDIHVLSPRRAILATFNNQSSCLSSCSHSSSVIRSGLSILVIRDVWASCCGCGEVALSLTLHREFQSFEAAEWWNQEPPGAIRLVTQL